MTDAPATVSTVCPPCVHRPEIAPDRQGTGPVHRVHRVHRSRDFLPNAHARAHASLFIKYYGQGGQGGQSRAQLERAVSTVVEQGWTRWTPPENIAIRSVEHLEAT